MAAGEQGDEHLLDDLVLPDDDLGHLRPDALVSLVEQCHGFTFKLLIGGLIEGGDGGGGHGRVMRWSNGVVE